MILHGRQKTGAGAGRAVGRAEWLARRCVVLAAVAVAAGCAPRSSGPRPMDAPAMVEVDNRAFLDANVYVLRSGQRIRLGIATGSGRTIFTLPRGLVNGATPLSFLVDFVGSSRSPISEAITVLPGDTVMLIVPPQ